MESSCSVTTPLKAGGIVLAPLATDAALATAVAARPSACDSGVREG
jgi:hypothetical protein